MNYNLIESVRFKLLYSIFFLSIWTILYSFSLYWEYTPMLGYVSTILLIIQALWLIFRSFVKRNILHVVFWGFTFLYTLPAKLFFFDRLYLSGHNMSYTDPTVLQVTLIFSLYLILVNLFLKITQPQNYTKIHFKNNQFIFYVLYAVSFFIVLISKRSGSLYDGSGADVEVSSLNEYVIILFLVLYIYSNNKYANLCLLAILYTCYIIFAMLNGGRIEVVLLCLLLLNIRFQYSFSFKKIVFLFLFAVWAMSIFGTIRYDPVILFEKDIVDIINPLQINKEKGECQASNEGDVYWASERMFLLMQDGQLSLIDRVESGTNYFLSFFIPTSYLSSLANLSSYKKEFRNSGGGGLAPVYFYVMFGIAGVIMLAFFVSKILNALVSQTSAIKQFYAILMVTTLPRWFAYYPLHLIKFCVWGVLFYCVILSFDYTLKKYAQKYTLR